MIQLTQRELNSLKYSTRRYYNLIRDTYLANTIVSNKTIEFKDVVGISSMIRFDTNKFVFNIDNVIKDSVKVSELGEFKKDEEWFEKMRSVILLCLCTELSMNTTDREKNSHNLSLDVISRNMNKKLTDLEKQEGPQMAVKFKIDLKLLYRSINEVYNIITIYNAAAIIRECKDELFKIKPFNYDYINKIFKDADDSLDNQAKSLLKNFSFIPKIYSNTWDLVEELMRKMNISKSITVMDYIKDSLADPVHIAYLGIILNNKMPDLNSKMVCKLVSNGRMNTRKNILSFMDNMDKVGEFYDDRKVIVFTPNNDNTFLFLRYFDNNNKLSSEGSLCKSFSEDNDIYVDEEIGEDEIRG